MCVLADYWRGVQSQAGRKLTQSLGSPPFGMGGLKFGSSTGALNSLISLALISGDVNTAQTLIKQGLQQGDLLDVSQALSQASALVSVLGGSQFSLNCQRCCSTRFALRTHKILGQ